MARAGGCRACCRATAQNGIPRTLKHGGFYLRDPDARLGLATPDVVVHDPERGLGVVQIKSVENGIFRKKWRDADTGALRRRCGSRCKASSRLTWSARNGPAVAPLVVGFGVDLHLIEIPIHAGVIDRLKAEIVLFWQRVADHRPYEPDYGRDGAIIAQLFGKDDGSTIDSSHPTTGFLSCSKKMSSLRASSAPAPNAWGKSAPKSIRQARRSCCRDLRRLDRHRKDDQPQER